MTTNRTNKKFLSDVDSRDLIRAIKERPALYDYSLLKTPRKEHRLQLWQEVGERLTDTDIWEGYSHREREARLEEIREKWRHLRNNFLRELKCLKSGEKKRKYIFFDEMEFMTPFVGLKLRGPNKQKHESSEQDSGNTDSLRDFTDESDFIQEHFDAMTNSNDEEDQPLSSIGRPRKLPNTKASQITTRSSSASTQKLTKEQAKIIKRFDVIKKMPRRLVRIPAPAKAASSSAIPVASSSGVKHVVSATGNPNRLSLRFFDMRDSDISFCMSMVSTFRKMGESRKLRAKIDMLKVLHKYADNLDESPKQKVKAEHQTRSHTNVNNNINTASCLEEDLYEGLEDNSNENVGDDLIKAENNLSDGSNVWWT